MRTFFLFAALTALCLTANAQDKPYKAKHRFFYAPVSGRTGGVTIEISDAVGELTLLKFKLKVINKTGDYLFVDPSRFKLRMGDALASFKEKPFVVRPFEDASKVLDATGAASYQHEAPVLDFADGIQSAPGKGRTTAMDDFKLPAAQNSVSAGPYSVNLKDLVKETDKTTANFTVQYTGSAVGVVDPSRIGVRIPAGQVFANEKSKSKPVLLDPGGTDNFKVVAVIPGKIVDMQFAELTVLWNDAFTETAKSPFSVEPITFPVDQERTKKEN